MATKVNPGAYDCYENAEPDEPMFILLARDSIAPWLTELWAVLREIAGGDDSVEKHKQAYMLVLDAILHMRQEKKSPANPEKIADALSCAQAMREWKKQRKVVSDETND